ncbi:MAG: anion permease, partial [Acidaminococcales bacterium]|nr:anion permease [Acidaminococcales bacterium]
PSLPIIGILMGTCIMAHDIFLTPVNSANTMIAYGTEAFKPGDMFRIGVPFTAVLFVLVLAWMLIYWPIVGLS